MEPKIATHYLMPFRQKDGIAISDCWNDDNEVKKRLFKTHSIAQKDGKIIQCLWENDPWYKATHLLNYVNQVVSTEENDIDSGMRHYCFNSNYRKHIDLPKRAKEKITLVDRYEVNIHSIEVFYFKSGIGFLDVVIEYNCQIQDIPDVVNLLKKVSNKKINHYHFTEKKSKNECEKKEIVHSLYYKLIGDTGKKESTGEGEFKNAEFFFSCGATAKHQAFVYTTIRTPEGDEDLRRQVKNISFNLMRGYSSAYAVSFQSQTEGEICYQPYPYITWHLSQEGIVCSYQYNEEGCLSGQFNVSTFEGNLKRDWMVMFLLLLHQKYGLYHFMEEMLKDRNNTDELKDLQKRFFDFQMYYAFNVVSDERTYHHVFLQMKKILCLSELYADIQDVTNKIVDNNFREEKELQEKQKKYNDAEKEKEENRQNVVGLLIALLAMVSVFADGIFVLQLFGMGEVMAKIICTGITIITVIFSICLYSGKIKLPFKSNNNEKRDKK